MSFGALLHSTGRNVADEKTGMSKTTFLCETGPTEHSGG